MKCNDVVQLKIDPTEHLHVMNILFELTLTFNLTGNAISGNSCRKFFFATNLFLVQLIYKG